jgi:hypothetical protein
MNLPRYSRLKWLGIVLMFAAFGIVLLPLIAFAIFRPSLSDQDQQAAVAGLFALTGGSLAAGMMVLVFESRRNRRKSNSN